MLKKQSNCMANPLWVPGSKSANPTGRPKNSVRTPKGLVERFIKRVITPNRMKRMFDELTSMQQFDVIIALMPYVEARKSSEAIDPQEIERLYSMVENLANGTHGKAI